MPLQIRTTLQYTTGLPRDVSVNTLTIGDPTSGPELTDAVAAILNFYNGDITVGPYTGCVADFYTPAVSGSANEALVEVFEIDLPTGALTPLGSPTPWTFASTSSGDFALPFEVALCASFRSAIDGSSPRTQGRIYIGPLNNLAIDDGDFFGRPSAFFQAILNGAMGRLASDLSDNNTPLMVWSRAGHSATAVTNGWVDNEFDTQRRREIDASQRLTWGLM